MGAEGPVAVATLAVRLQNGDQLLGAARRGGEQPDLLAWERLAVAIGKPPGDRGMAPVAHAPGGPEHRYSAADAPALAMPPDLLAHRLGPLDARAERRLDPQRQRDRLRGAGHADVAGEVGRLRSQGVAASGEAVVWGAGHEAGPLEPGGKRLPDARAFRAQLDLSASHARHPLGDRDRDLGRIVRGRSLEAELRRLRVIAQYYRIGGVLLGLISGLVAPPKAQLGLAHGYVEASDARESVSFHGRRGRPRRIAHRTRLVEGPIDGCVRLGRVLPRHREAVLVPPSVATLDSNRHSRWRGV